MTGMARILAAALAVNLAIFVLAPALVLDLGYPPEPETEPDAYTVRVVSAPFALPAGMAAATPLEEQAAGPPAVAPSNMKPIPMPRLMDMPPVPGASLASVAAALRPNLGPPAIMTGTPGTSTPSTLRMAANPDGSAGDSVDEMPRIVSQAPLMYPERARQQGIQGSVTVRFLVGTRGKVERVEIFRSEPAGVFDDAVRRTIGSYRFKPARKDGNPVPTWMETTVRFQLDG